MAIVTGSSCQATHHTTFSLSFIIKSFDIFISYHNFCWYTIHLETNVVLHVFFREINKNNYMPNFSYLTKVTKDIIHLECLNITLFILMSKIK